ncbi:Lmo0850 family protein [Staphylococcus aureus]
MNKSDKLQNVVKLLSSLGVNIKKTKSHFDIINTLPTTKTVTQELK